MIDLDQLEALAKAAGGDEWTPTYATRTDLARVWLPDGDGIAKCFGNIGRLPEPIDADDVAEFIAAANPAAILKLCAEVRTLRKDATNKGAAKAWCDIVDLLDELEVPGWRNLINTSPIDFVANALREHFTAGSKDKS